MSRLGKGLLALAGLSLIIGGLSRAILPDWTGYLWIPFAAAAAFWVVEIATDFRFYKEFLTLKTTKHGMNMGVMILLLIVLLVAVNFVVVKKNKKWDLSAEKVNSLSDQTTKLLKSLKGDLEITGFFRDDVREEEQLLFEAKHFLSMLKDESPKVKYEMANPIKRPDLAKQMDVDTSGVLVLKYGDKKATVSEFTEENIANAIVKVTRERNKTLYYLTGHGEVDMDNADKQGGSYFKKALQDSSFDLVKLNLLEGKGVPDTAEVVMIIGPRQALLEPEIQALEEFAKRGGCLFVAADPGMRHNIGEFLKKFGVNFNNDYIIDQVGQLMGQSAALAVGMNYSQISEITKMFTNQITAFQLASSLSRDEKAPADFRFDEIVKSSQASFSKKSITGHVTFDEKTDKKGPLTLAMTVTGALGSKTAEAKKAVDSSRPEDKKKFTLVAFGDGDFVTNQLLEMQLNRNLALNAVAYLTKDSDLISIKPKNMQGSRLNITNTQASLLIFGIYLPIPLLLLVTAGVIWFKRRGA